MSWWIPAAFTLAGSLISSESTKSQNSNQLAWNNYNANMQRNVDLVNIRSMQALSGLNQRIANFNADLTEAAAGYNLEFSKVRADMSMKAATYNASLMRAVTDYNDLLMAEEERMLWETLDLDLELMALQRRKERGAIRATQAASGTVMDIDSNLDVLIDQKTQEELDAFVVRHQADVEASKIANARAQSRWHGEMQARSIMWEGQLSAVGEMVSGYQQYGNTMLEAMGIRAQGALAAAEGSIQAAAARQTSDYRYRAGLAGAQQSYQQNETTRKNNLVQGLFGAASSGATLYYGTKAVDPGAGGSMFLLG